MSSGEVRIVIVGLLLLASFFLFMAVTSWWEEKEDLRADDESALQEEEIAWNRDRAIRILQDAGARVEFDERLAGNPEVVAVDLRDTFAYTDNLLLQVKGFKELRSLDLGRANVTDRGLEHIKELSSLRALRIDCDVRSRGIQTGLVHLRGLSNLESLSLRHVDAFRREFARAGMGELRQLRSLDLYGCSHFDDAALATLRELKRLEAINLGGTWVTDAGLAYLKAFPKLTRLTLDDSLGRLSDAGLAHLRDLSRLQSLRLALSKMTDAGLGHLRGLTDLRELQLEQSRSEITDNGLANLETLKKLESLTLNSPNLSDAGLAHIQGLTRLQRLILSSQFTDAGFEHLKGLKELRLLRVCERSVSKQKVDDLKKSMPGLKIICYR